MPAVFAESLPEAIHSLTPRRLNLHGYTIGQRLLELLLWRDGRSAKRETRILGILQFITTTLYRSIFNKPADALEKSRDNEDEYMLIDNDPMVSSYISIPKEMSQLNCAAFVAGIIEAVLDGCLFPSRVTAHSVPTEQFPGKTVFLSKLMSISSKPRSYKEDISPLRSRPLSLRKRLLRVAAQPVNLFFLKTPFYRINNQLTLSTPPAVKFDESVLEREAVL